MLISHKHRFIFIHIYKNAGTSIGTALLPFATYNRAHLLGIQVAERYGLPVPFALNPHPMNSHIKAQDVIRRLGRARFDSYFSFAIVRNPWDWQVSLYNYMRKNTEHRQYDKAQQFSGFEDYLEWRCRYDVHLQKEFIYSLEDELLVDFIGRYETLDADFQKICQHIGIQAQLPTLNVSKSRPYQSYYTPETIELVRTVFSPDIELFGYHFE